MRSRLPHALSLSALTHLSKHTQGTRSGSSSRSSSSSSSGPICLALSVNTRALPPPVQVAEKYLRASGLRYTIVRPGGLSDEAPGDVGRLITSGEDTLFGLDTDPGRAISRDTVRAGPFASEMERGAARGGGRVRLLPQRARLLVWCCADAWVPESCCFCCRRCWCCLMSAAGC